MDARIIKNRYLLKPNHLHEIYCWLLLTSSSTMMDQMAIKMKNLARRPTKYLLSCSTPIYIFPRDFVRSTNSILGAFVLICSWDWIWAVNQCNLVCAWFYLLPLGVCTLKISAGADVTEQNAFVCVFLSEESEVTGDETCINYQGN